MVPLSILDLVRITEATSASAWMLSSSTFGAALAAQLGLPYAFASHFAPQQLLPALDLRSFELISQALA